MSVSKSIFLESMRLAEEAKRKPEDIVMDLYHEIAKKLEHESKYTTPYNFSSGPTSSFTVMRRPIT